MPNATHDELSERARKRLAALGHHLAQLDKALTALRNRLCKDKVPEQLAEHARLCFGWLPEQVMPDAFEVVLGAPECAPEDWTAVAQDRPPCLSDAACALLHLPGLRRMWLGWLRGSVLEDLRRRLPRAWVWDPKAVPPHGAIAGLGIADWGDLARLQSRGRAFRIRFADGDPDLELSPEQTAAAWTAAAQRLKSGKPGQALIAEVPPRTPARWRASFARRDERWEMIELKSDA